jgi:hypothetical protein
MNGWTVSHVCITTPRIMGQPTPMAGMPTTALWNRQLSAWAALINHAGVARICEAEAYFFDGSAGDGLRIHRSRILRPKVMKKRFPVSPG